MKSLYIYCNLNQNTNSGSSRCDSIVMNLTSIQEEVGLIPGSSQWVKGLVLPQPAAEVTDVPIWHLALLCLC